ncbi:MAG: retroviral-like aspartic protease family protein [Bacteroidales bacterium]|nr:retroviral-like aspartic protease family protein [Bacteroidales bacterium]
MRHYVEVPIRLLNIEDEGFHVMIKGKINGMEANFLVDTGASRTIFSLQDLGRFIPQAELEKKEGIAAGIGSENLDSFLFTIDRLQLGDIDLDDYEAAAIDLDSIHENYQKLGLPHIDAVIGGDLLMRLKATINYRLRKIRFTRPRSKVKART